MPGAVASNFSRNFDPALTARLLKEAGVEFEVKPGERLPDEVIDKLQRAMRKLFGSADDVATAVFYAVTQPIDVNVFEIVIRPPKMLGL
jgi:NADP-dependent 3-hydroxy acid dehydrogenase YdfG